MIIPAHTIEIVGLVILSVVLAVVLWAYSRMLKKMQAAGSQMEESDELIRHKAEKIIELARQKAEQILTDAKVDQNRIQQELAGMIDKAEEAHFTEYKERLQNISKDIEDRLSKGADDYGKVLESEIVTAQKTVTKKLEEEYAQVEKELEEYKTQRLVKMESVLQEGLKAGLKKVYGEMLTVTEHEGLAMQAIEEAKKQNVF